MTLNSNDNPYIVTDNVTVPAGKKLVITKGCIVLFKPFTGISVEGTIVVEGSIENPVIFSSEFDTKFNSSSTQFPNPFDWNGILIHQKATEALLSNFHIKYSVYGLKSYKEDIFIENGIFSNNGQSNLSINEMMKNVADGIPFSYQKESLIHNSLKKQEQETQQSKTLQSDQPSVNVLKKEKKPLTIKKVAALCCIGGGTLCLGFTSYFCMQIIDNQNKYLGTLVTEEMETYKVKRKDSAVSASLSAITMLLFAGGATTLFIIDKKEYENSKGIAVLPVWGECNGLALTITF
jgi:hypothetical protein